MTSLSTLLPLLIAPDHPAFAGHFPGHPIVPGVVLLDEALQCLAAAEHLEVTTIQVGVAKFLRPVRPGEALSLLYRRTSPGRYALEIRVGDEAVAATATVTVQTMLAEQEG
jgi:3-hydroxymyristoyl/3-hydroxydecanoyl-(acyl carrier protein) dehydratase